MNHNQNNNQYDQNQGYRGNNRVNDSYQSGQTFQKINNNRSYENNYHGQQGRSDQNYQKNHTNDYSRSDNRSRASVIPPSGSNADHIIIPQ